MTKVKKKKLTEEKTSPNEAKQILYKGELRDFVILMMNEFLTIEQGNRLTVNNYNTFINNILKAFQSHEIK